jgi:hypothetical protein
MNWLNVIRKQIQKHKRLQEAQYYINTLRGLCPLFLIYKIVEYI